MPRHLVRDVHEGMKEIPTVATYCLGKPQPWEQAGDSQRGKKTV